ncbi:unnamed protein product [Vicia faba]|uniref:Uncharacterized protein n=1 Tax=Vicia faba TaxID=3906 RepID=A0AAV1AD63_VICFA|nr:unnamed protein product [Vicia faba]
MTETTNTFVLFLLLVTMFLNGYSAEEVGGTNQLKKDDGIYKSQKFGKCVDGMILYGMCLSTPYFWPVYGKFCTNIDHTNVAPNSSVTPKLESDVLP